MLIARKLVFVSPPHIGNNAVLCLLRETRPVSWRASVFFLRVAFLQREY